MLLQHAWLAPLAQIDTITEEEEEEVEAAVAARPTDEVAPTNGADDLNDGTQWVDKEVGMWVREQLRKKKEGLLGKVKKPALHAAPLDAVPSPDPGAKHSNKGAVAV